MIDSTPSGTYTNQSGRVQRSSAAQFLSGGGEMGELTRNFDWSDTPVGDPENWVPALRLIVATLLNARFPMFLWWGPELIQFYNDAYRPVLGKQGKHPAALGQRGQDHWPEIWPIIKPLIDQVLAGGESVWRENELISIHRNDRLEDAYWTFSYSPVLNDSGEVGGVLVVCQETTRVVANEKIRQKLLASFEQSPVAIATISDPDLTFRMANPFYCQLVGRTAEELVGKPLLEVLPEIRDQGFAELIRQVMATGIPYVASERAVTIIRKGRSETIHVSLTYHPQHETDPRTGLDYISGILVIATDVTEPVQARQQVERSNEELKNLVADLDRSNQGLQQFAYVASHDLQEPLRKIQAFGDLLKEQHGSELGGGIDYLERMQTAARRMSVLIGDLLDYSRMSIQQKISDTISLSGVVDAVLSDLDLLIEETGTVVTVEPLPTLQGDASQLHQLFQNLLSNAIKFRRPGISPLIRVSAQLVMAADLPPNIKPSRAAVAYHRIDVADNGIGFNNQYADRIFEVFHRLHGRNQYAGTGIGLAICQKVAINHGGAIRATSQPNQGAMFSVYLQADVQA